MGLPVAAFGARLAAKAGHLFNSADKIKKGAKKAKYLAKGAKADPKAAAKLAAKATASGAGKVAKAAKANPKTAAGVAGLGAAAAVTAAVADGGSKQIKVRKNKEGNPASSSAYNSLKRFGKPQETKDSFVFTLSPEEYERYKKEK